MDMRYEADDYGPEDDFEALAFEYEDDEDDFEDDEDDEGELEFSAYELDDELDEPYQFEDEDDDEDEIDEYAFFEDDEDDFEDDEIEDAYEQDEEFGKLFRRVKKGLGNVVRRGAKLLKKVAGPLLKKLGPIAARIVGAAIGGPAGAKIAGTIASAILREGEMENAESTEIEFERDEADFEALGGRMEVFEDMEDAAAEIAEADTEREANRGLMRLIGGATRLFGSNRRLKPVIPLVARAAVALVKTFRADRKTRWAVRAIPLIVRRVLSRLARSRKVDRKTVVLAMSRETAWVLANRRRASKALSGSRSRSGRGKSRRRGRGKIRARSRRRNRGTNREEMFL